MELQEVKQFLRDNAGKDDVKSYLAELSKVSPDAEEAIVSNFKRSKDFQSEIDRAVTKAINTYNEKTVPSLIEKEVKFKEEELEKKYNPPKNPAEEAMRKQLEKLTLESAENKKKIIQKELRNRKQALLNSKEIPIEYEDLIAVGIDNLSIEDVENESKLDELIMPKVEKLSKLIQEAQIKKATEMQKGSAFKPQNSNANTNSGQLTLEQYKALPHEERMKAQKEGRVDQILGRQ